MNRKKIVGLLSIATSFALLGGALSFVGGVSISNEAEVVKAEENTTNNVAAAGEHIYLELDAGYWATDGADVYMDIFYTNSNNEEVLSTITFATNLKTTSEVVLMHTLTSDEASMMELATNFTFRRVATGTSSQWNYWTAYVGDLTPYNYYTISGWDNSGTYTWAEENTVYFQKDSGYNTWSSTVYAYPYTYSESENTSFYTFPGFTLDLNVTNATDFKYISSPQSGAIYCAKVLSTFNRIIFSGYPSGWTTPEQTEDCVITDGAYYNWTLNYSGSDNTAGDAALGLAAKYVYDTDRAIKNVSSSGSVLSGSICGLTSSEASSLYAEYAAITDSSALSITNSSTLYTYDPSDENAQANVTYEAIAAQLNLLASGSSTSSLVRTGLLNGDSVPYIVIGVVSVIAIIGVAGFIAYSKKRKASSNID